MGTSDIVIEQDSLAYTPRSGLRSREPTSLAVGSHNRVEIRRPMRLRAATAYGAFRHDSAVPNASVVALLLGLSLGEFVDRLRNKKGRQVAQVGFGAKGETQSSPPLSTKCHEAPRGLCRVSEAPTKRWEYEPLSETNDPYWSKLETYGFKPEHAASSSKRILWERKSKSECDVRLEVKGDLDGDGVFGRSTTPAVVGPGGTLGPLPDPGTRHPE